MNNLLAITLMALGTGGQSGTKSNLHIVSTTSVSTQQSGHLSILGPGMHGTPAPLGGGDCGVIKAGKYNPSDFIGQIARPGTTPAPSRKNVKAAIGFTPTAVVYYDSTGTYGWIGSIYAYQVGNLLTHFGVTVTRKGIETYKKNELAKYTMAVYIGTEYGNPLPAAFKTDFVANKLPFVWTGYNLWEVAWNSTLTAWNPSFSNAFGFQFEYLDSTYYPTVSYNGATLTKQPSDPTQGDTVVTNPSLATVLATSSNGTSSQAYITRGGNFWYVADNPLEYVQSNRGDDRYLAFSDILNDVTGIVEPQTKRACLRIEDVSAICDTASLRGIADTLYALNIPYVVCVIPDYKDPNGVFNGGVPLEIQMQNNETFIQNLLYMQSKGAQIIMHGVTHQYSNVPNPDNAVSAEDVEFFRVETDALGNQQPIGPIPGDSTSWCTTLINSGQRMFKEAGFLNVTGWNTPHYYATPTDYRVFSKQFDYSMDKVLTFATDSNGNLQYLVQPSPYAINDEYGNHRIPETLGYCDPNGTSGKVNLPADMIGYANAVQCVRGGWASCYYHWFLGTSMLQQLVQGIQAAGYTFTMPSSSEN